jgi:membrane glycosyltransferase
VGWKTQRRDDGSIPLHAIVRRHLTPTVCGVVLAIAAYAIAPPFLAWMSPVVLGLLLAIPISAATARQTLGRMVRRLGLLVTPEETEPPVVLQRANQLTRELAMRRLGRADALEWMACDTELRAIHTGMLSAVGERRKREYDVDLLLGLAKLNDADSIEEACALLSSREKLAVLGDRAGIERLRQLGELRAARPTS